MADRRARAVLPCPAVPEHGELVMVEGSDRLRCIHQEHDGRPKTHPLGEAPATRCVFTLHEVEAARKAVLV